MSSLSVLIDFLYYANIFLLHFLSTLLQSRLSSSLKIKSQTHRQIYTFLQLCFSVDVSNLGVTFFPKAYPNSIINFFTFSSSLNPMILNNLSPYLIILFTLLILFSKSCRLIFSPILTPFHLLLPFFLIYWRQYCSQMDFLAEDMLRIGKPALEVSRTKQMSSYNCWLTSIAYANVNFY